MLKYSEDAGFINATKVSIDNANGYFYVFVRQ
jgi:hypothetical protein